jgi:hypothetical protein
MKRFNLVIVVIVLLATLVGVGVSQKQVAAQTSGPCDIYAAGGTPCVAAHSTVRALFGAYSGRLYQVRRASNGNTMDIGTLNAGGFANGPAQDTFCAGTTCTIVQIYDQTSRGNHLTVAPAGGNGSADSPSNATALPLTLGGKKVYGLFIAAGNGYRDNTTSGIPTGSASAGTYAVMSGTHVNSGCCFDYGNAETNNLDNGNGRMGAIYLGKLCWFSPCNGAGPWVMADLENGLFAGANGSWSNNTSVPFTYVTAMVKNDSTTYAIKGGNAQQSGSLKTMYNGALPTQSGYTPLKLEGAIILGIGGDNSKVAVGSYFEGAMTAGKPSDSTENSVHANVVAVYSTAGSAGGNPTPIPGTFTRLVNQNSGKCLDVQNPNLNDGANVGIFTCNGGAWQNWQLVDLGNGYFRIVSQNSGKCLDVSGASTADGGNVIQWACNGGTNQQWQKTTTTAPWFRLTSRNSGKVLDVNGCGTADGTNVQQWTWLNNGCQQWQTQ